jgi:hopanoid biosynthesis associated protein HpnK
MNRILCVTGDDFGASEGTNAGIARAHRSGVLGNASLMVLGGAREQAVEIARSLPKLCVGLHLVLCDGKAASAPSSIPDLVDAQGRFPSTPLAAGLRDWIERRKLREQLEREIRAQIEAFLATGLALEYVDGHHHLHMHPVIFERLLACAVEYRIPWVRIVHEDDRAHAPRLLPRIEPVPWIFARLANVHRRALAQAGIGAPERVYGLRATGSLSAESLLELVPRLVASPVEIYAHPDDADERGRRETDALCDARVGAAIERAGYTLSNTRQAASAVRAATASATPYWTSFPGT